jgi:hypothetical protein
VGRAISGCLRVAAPARGACAGSAVVTERVTPTIRASCAGVVCHQGTEPISASPRLLSADPVYRVLSVTVGVTSPTMPYPVVGGSIIPIGHLLYDLLGMERGHIVVRQAALPFKTSRRECRVSCEAVRLGEQIFAFFHVDLPPSSSVNQLTLF